MTTSIPLHGNGGIISHGGRLWQGNWKRHLQIQVPLYCGEMYGSVKCKAVEFGVFAVLAHDEAEIHCVLSGHGAHQVSSFRAGARVHIEAGNFLAVIRVDPDADGYRYVGPEVHGHGLRGIRSELQVAEAGGEAVGNILHRRGDIIPLLVHRGDICVLFAAVQVAGIAGGYPLPGIQAVDVRALGGHFHRAGGYGPAVFVGDLSEVNLPVLPFRGVDRLEHCLAGILVRAGLAVVEHIPLAVHLHHGTVVVAPAVGHGVEAVLPGDDLAAVEADVPAVAESVQRMVAPLVGQEAVAVLIDAQRGHMAVHAAGIDKHILPENLPRAGCLEERVVPHAAVIRRPLRTAVRDRVLLDGTGLDRRHVVVQFGAPAFAEAPVGIHAPVVIHEDAGVELQFGLHRVGEGSPGLIGLRHHDAGPAALRRVHVIDAVLLHHVRRVQGTVVQRFVAYAVAGPVGQVVCRRGPDHVVHSAVFGLQGIVGTVQVYPRFPVVRKGARLPVRHMLPQRHIGVGSPDPFLFTHGGFSFRLVWFH